MKSKCHAPFGPWLCLQRCTSLHGPLQLIIPAATAHVHVLLNQADVPVHADMNPSFHMWGNCLSSFMHMLTMKVAHRRDRKQTPQFSLEIFVHINNYL